MPKACPMSPARSFGSTPCPSAPEMVAVQVNGEFVDMENYASTFLASGDDVLISGFGKFRVKDKKERRGRNPATNDSLILEPRRVVTFKCSGKLRDRINGYK